MQIIRQKTNNLVMYAGADLSANEIANLGDGWCDERVSLSLADVISGITLPVGFIPDCWTYNAGIWAIYPGLEQKVYDHLFMIIDTEPHLYESDITTGLDMAVDGTITAWFDISWSSVQTATTYEIRYRSAGESVWGLVSLAGSGPGKLSLRISGLLPARKYEFTLRASCLWGMSDWTVMVTKTSPPPNLYPDDVSLFTATTQQDGTRQFAWSIPDGATSGYKIKYSHGAAGTWGAMMPLHTGLLSSSPYETNQLPSGVYTFGIVAVNSFGKESVNPKIVEATLDEPRLSDVWASSVSVGNSWPGVKTDCHVTASGTLEVDDQSTWDTVPTWDAWDAWVYSPKSSMSYVTPTIDLGSQTSFSPVFNVYGTGTITKQMATSTDNVTWSSWDDLGAASARYVKFMATVVTVAGIVSELAEVAAYIIVRTKSEVVSNLNTANLAGQYRLGVGDIRVPLSIAYTTISSIQVSIQNLGTGSDFVVVDKDVTIGPRIKILDGFSSTDAIIDVTISGV